MSNQSLPPTPVWLTPNHLRWIIALSLLAPYISLADNNLQAVAGASGTPLISDQHGVPVIDIVAPNAAGLSHNQFLDYNVSTPGVVLNNALQAGQSQLAGALAANPQFQGQAASTILNEVISRNASRIEGMQEIFGRPADYILANPNGITLNGGGFINTTRAGFLVGTVELDEQRIKHLDTRNASGSLQVLEGGHGNSDGALDLIAPRIDSLGPLAARDELSLTVGRNLIQAADQQVLEHLAAPQGSIDASLFGAMQAGRIRILSTAEGAGVRVASSRVQAPEGIDIASAGALQISGSAEQPSLFSSDRGTLAMTAAGDLSLTAVHANAQRIQAHAGNNLTLDSQVRETLDRERENREEKWWFITTETYDRETTRTNRYQIGTDLQASQDIDLAAGQDMSLTAATVQANGNLSVRAGNELNITAGIDSQQVDEQIRHRKNLWRGDKDSSIYQESARPSELSAGQLSLASGQRTTLRGSNLSSTGDMTLQGGAMELAEVFLNSTESSQDYSGDLVSGTFFGNRGEVDNQSRHASGSTIQAGGALTVVADEVRVRGSRVNSVGDALVLTERAALSIEAAQSQSTQSQRDSDSKLFGLISQTSERQEQRQDVLISDLASESNLRLASADELRVIGARLNAGQQLQLQAQGDITLDAAEQQQTLSTLQQDKGFTASASQTQDAGDGKPDSKQYSASVGYNVNSVQATQTETTQVTSVLTGANVQITTPSDVTISGANISASDGDLLIEARDVNLVALHDEQSRQTTSTQSGGGLTVSGGIDYLGSAFEGYRRQQVLDERSTQARPTRLATSGNLGITADRVINEATRMTAGQALALTASTLENRAVNDTRASQLTENNWQASLGASVVYRDLTRPIENLVIGNEPNRFQQASIEDALAPPTLGAELNVSHLNRTEIDQATTAQVTELTAGSISINAGTLDDTGTQYRAEQGPVSIEAQSHHFVAAQDSASNSVQRLDVEAGLRVETSTGSDINLRLSGKGGSLLSESLAQTARPGSLYGQTGIQIQLGSDGAYEGTRFDAGVGSLRLSAAGNLSLEQANDRQRSTQSSLEGSAWAKGGNNPMGSGLELRGYLDNSHRESNDSQARVAEIDARGDVQLQAGGTLGLVGTRIGSERAKVANISLQSSGALQVNAATDTHRAEGSNLGGGLELTAKSTSNGKGGGVGGHVSNGRLDERTSTAHAASWFADDQLALSSAARQEEAVHLQGVKATAARVDISAAQGGILIEAASNSDQRNNLDLTAGAGVNAAPGATAEQAQRGLYARAQVNIDRRDNLTWDNSQWQAGQITLNSLGDTRLEGVRMDAGQIDGTIGGDLRVASRQDRVNALTVEVDARLSQEKNPQGYLNATTAFAGPLASKVEKNVGAAVQKVDPKLSPTLNLRVERTQRDSVANQSVLNGRDGIHLAVGGGTELSGARLQAVNGTVELGSGQVSRQTLNGRDYRREVGINASNAPVDLVSGLINAYSTNAGGNGENPVDLGLVRTSGHDRTVELTSSISR